MSAVLRKSAKVMLQLDSGEDVELLFKTVQFRTGLCALLSKKVIKKQVFEWLRKATKS